jgi:hypothetical protein
MNADEATRAYFNARRRTVCLLSIGLRVNRMAFPQNVWAANGKKDKMENEAGQT